VTGFFLIRLLGVRDTTFVAVGLNLLASAAAMSGAPGAVYSVNTVGCIAGSLGAGFVLIPVLGGYRAMVAVAVLSALLGHRLLAPRWGAAGWRRRLASIALVATLGTALGGWALRNDSYPWGRPGLEMVFSREEPGALVTVYRGPMGFYLYGDDTPLAFPIGPRTKTVAVQRAQAQIPLLLHPNPKRVLVVGLGFGVTSGEFAQCGSLERVDTVELLSGVIAAAPLFAEYNYGVGNGGKSSIIAGTGGTSSATPRSRMTSSPPTWWGRTCRGARAVTRSSISGLPKAGWRPRGGSSFMPSVGSGRLSTGPWRRYSPTPWSSGPIRTRCTSWRPWSR